MLAVGGSDMRKWIDDVDGGDIPSRPRKNKSTSPVGGSPEKVMAGGSGPQTQAFPSKPLGVTISGIDTSVRPQRVRGPRTMDAGARSGVGRLNQFNLGNRGIRKGLRER